MGGPGPCPFWQDHVPSFLGRLGIEEDCFHSFFKSLHELSENGLIKVHFLEGGRWVKAAKNKRRNIRILTFQDIFFSPLLRGLNYSTFTYLFILFKFIYLNWRLITLQYFGAFAIHSHESAMGVDVFAILNLPIPSLRVIQVNQHWVPCFMHWNWTGEIFHI